MTLGTLLLYAAGALFVAVIVLAVIAPPVVLGILVRSWALARQRDEEEALSRARRRTPLSPLEGEMSGRTEGGDEGPTVKPEDETDR